MSYNVFIVVLILLVGNTVAPIYPYGCVECNQKNMIYCRSGFSPNEYYNCYKSVDSCAATSDQIVPASLCSNVPAQCADKNYQCSACVGTSGCKMCVSTGQYCMPTTAPCEDTVIATNSAGCSTSAYTTNVNCNSKSTCSSCVSTSGCYYIPEQATTPFAPGCTSVQSTKWNSLTDCNDPAVVCPARTTGSYSDTCKCVPDITDTKCTICYGTGPTAAETNYKCTSRDLPVCTTVTNDCYDTDLTCPPLINKFDPYGTRANCLTNPDCSICVTKPVSSITPSTLKCIPTVASSSSCSAITRNANDPKIVCPTKLTCTDCAAAGCDWCSSSDLLFSSSCAATGSCGTNQVVDNSCTDNCSSFKTCNTCPTASGCSWCSNTEFGLQKCVKQCATISTTQKKITDCTQANSCSAYNDNCQSCITNSCTYCDGNGRSDGGNPGDWCSSSTNCNNVAGCGQFEPCLGVPVTNTANCKASFCTKYTDCLSCAGQTDEIQHCYWCDNKGTRYCDAGCNNGTATRVSNCAVFGPTTGGLPTGTSGQTGSPSTGSSGNTPGPATGPQPGGSGPQPGGSGPQPGGSGPQPGGSGPQPGGPPNEPQPGGSNPQPAKGFVNSFSWMLGAILVVLVYLR